MSKRAVLGWLRYRTVIVLAGLMLAGFAIPSTTKVATANGGVDASVALAHGPVPPTSHSHTPTIFG